MKTKKELAEQQLDYINEIKSKLNLNVVTCGNCGNFILHKLENEKIICHNTDCDNDMDISDFPDLWYNGCIENMRFK